MKSIFVALVAVWASIFGGHQVATHSAPQAASAAVAVTSAPPTVALFPIEGVTPSLATTTQDSSSADATTTVVNNYITNPVVERVVDQQVTSSGISESYLDTRFSALDQSLRQLISQTASASLFSGPVATTPINGAAFALSQKIDHLAGASLVDVTVDGVSGLTDADIPDNITASNYLPLTGGSLTFASSTLISVLEGAYFGATATSSFDSTGALTLATPLLVSSGGTGAATFGQGWIYSNGGTGALTASTSPTVNYITATSTTATSTFAGGITGPNNFTVQSSNGNVGIGTTTPTANLTVANTDSSIVPLMIKSTSNAIIGLSNGNGNGYYLNNLSADNSLRLQYNGATRAAFTAGGRVGIGAISPNALMQLSSTTATTLLSVDGSSNVLTALSSGNVGIGTTSPATALSVSGNGYLTGGLGVGALNTTAGTGIITSKLGVGSATAPTYTIDAAGFINTDQYSGYKQAGNTILYASSTGQDVFVGQNAGAGVISGAPNAGAGDVALGYGAYQYATSTSAWGNTAVGYTALQGVSTSGGTGKYNTVLGFNSIPKGSTADNNIAIGVSVASTNQITGPGNIGIGRDTLSVLSSGQYNTGVGYQTLKSLTTGIFETAIGNQALFKDISGSENLALGDSAMYSSVTGTNNVGIGVTSLYYNGSPTSTIAIGRSAGQGVAAYSNQGGTYVGYKAGYSAGNSSDYNTLLGYQSGYNVSTGQYNVQLGYSGTTGGITTGSNNILIGKDVRYGLDGTASNQLNIGNLLFATGLGSAASASTGNVGIGTTTPWKTLSVTGTVGFDGLTGAFGAGSLCLTANKEVVYNSGSDSCLSSLRATKHDIQSLSLSAVDMVKSLQPVSFIYNSDASSTVRYGFIAEDAAAVDSHLGTYDQNGNISGVDDRSMLAIVVEALQSLIDTVGNFAESFTTKDLTFTRATGDEIDVQKLCVGSTCVTEDQLKTLLANAGSAGASSGSIGSGGGSAASPTPDASTTPDTTPPSITINGNNPAHVTVGASYSDLGASVTDNVDQNLGLKYFLNGALVSDIVIDTSGAATDTIDYVATDNAGNTATSTRTVTIDAPSFAAPLQPAPDTTATTTEATTTTQ